MSNNRVRKPLKHAAPAPIAKLCQLNGHPPLLSFYAPAFTWYGAAWN